MPHVGFELTILAGDRPQTFAIDRATTERGVFIIRFRYIFQQLTSNPVTNISLGLWFQYG